MYGSEAILPIEVEIPYLRVSLRGLVTNEEYIMSRIQELEFLDECTQKSFNHLFFFQKKFSRGYTKNVHH